VQERFDRVGVFAEDVGDLSDLHLLDIVQIDHRGSRDRASSTPTKDQRRPRQRGPGVGAPRRGRDGGGCRGAGSCTR